VCEDAPPLRSGGNAGAETGDDAAVAQLLSAQGVHNGVLLLHSDPWGID